MTTLKVTLSTAKESTPPSKVVIKVCYGKAARNNDNRAKILRDHFPILVEQLESFHDQYVDLGKRYHGIPLSIRTEHLDLQDSAQSKCFAAFSSAKDSRKVHHSLCFRSPLRLIKVLAKRVRKLSLWVEKEGAFAGEKVEGLIEKGVQQLHDDLSLLKSSLDVLAPCVVKKAELQDKSLKLRLQHMRHELPCLSVEVCMKLLISTGRNASLAIALVNGSREAEFREMINVSDEVFQAIWLYKDWLACVPKIITTPAEEPAPPAPRKFKPRRCARITRNQLADPFFDDAVGNGDSTLAMFGSQGSEREPWSAMLGHTAVNPHSISMDWETYRDRGRRRRDQRRNAIHMDSGFSFSDIYAGSGGRNYAGYRESTSRAAAEVEESAREVGGMIEAIESMAQSIERMSRDTVRAGVRYRSRSSVSFYSAFPGSEGADGNLDRAESADDG